MTTVGGAPGDVEITPERPANRVCGRRWKGETERTSQRTEATNRGRGLRAPTGRRRGRRRGRGMGGSASRRPEGRSSSPRRRRKRERLGDREPERREWGAGRRRKWLGFRPPPRPPRIIYRLPNGRIQRLDSAGSNGRQEARPAGWRWWAGPLAGRAAIVPAVGLPIGLLYRAVPRAGPACRGGGPSTKVLSGRAGPRHY